MFDQAFYKITLSNSKFLAGKYKFIARVSSNCCVCKIIIKMSNPSLQFAKARHLPVILKATANEVRRMQKILDRLRNND